MASIENIIALVARHGAPDAPALAEKAQQRDALKCGALTGNIPDGAVADARLVGAGCAAISGAGILGALS